MAKRDEKRRPTVADRFLATRLAAHEQILHPKAYEQIRNGVRNARKFVFDEDACRRIAHVVATIPDLLVREMQFARAPFDLTWIEWPSWYYWMALRDPNPGKVDSQGERG